MLATSKLIAVNPPYMIGNTQYPSNIEELWSDEELEEIGLYRVIVEQVPEDKVAVREYLQWVDNKVHLCFELGEKPYPTPDDISAERNRRELLGSINCITSRGTVPTDVRSERDLRNINALSTLATIMLSKGDAESVISFTGSDNVTRILTPQQMIEVAMYVFGYFNAIHIKSRTLKDMNPIPRDYADDRWWK